MDRLQANDGGGAVDHGSGSASVCAGGELTCIPVFPDSVNHRCRGHDSAAGICESVCFSAGAAGDSFQPPQFDAGIQLVRHDDRAVLRQFSDLEYRPVDFGGDSPDARCYSARLSLA